MSLADERGKVAAILAMLLLAGCGSEKQYPKEPGDDTFYSVVSDNKVINGTTWTLCKPCKEPHGN